MAGGFKKLTGHVYHLFRIGQANTPISPQQVRFWHIASHVELWPSMFGVIISGCGTYIEKNSMAVVIKKRRHLMHHQPPGCTSLGR